MNDKLFSKVKDLCKDTGLSEKYLKAITEKLGGSIEDDSTDDSAIETTANLIADVAVESQGEATRWANKKKPAKKRPKPKDDDPDSDPDETDDDDPDSSGDSGKGGGDKDGKSLLTRIKALEKELEGYEAEKARSARSKSIADAMEKHKIPAYLRERLAKSIGDDEDVEETVKSLRQDFITNGLMPKDSEGVKAVSEKQLDEAADSLLESITVK